MHVSPLQSSQFTDAQSSPHRDVHHGRVWLRDAVDNLGELFRGEVRFLFLLPTFYDRDPMMLSADRGRGRARGARLARVASANTASVDRGLVFANRDTGGDFRRSTGCSNPEIGRASCREGVWVWVVMRCVGSA